MQRPSPFLLHSWLSEWWRHHGDEGALAVQVAYRGGRLVGALPLYIRRERSLRVATFLGGERSELADLLCSPEEADDVVEGLISAASRSGHDYALLHGLPGSSRLGKALGPGLALVPRIEAPVLDLTDGWEQVYAAKTSSKKRNLHRRRRKQLQELGRVETRVLGSPDEIDSVLDDTFRLHEARWAGRYDGSGYATPVGRRFHRAAFRRLAEQDRVRIVTLELDGRQIAFHQYFALCGRMYVHRLAFDPALAKYSPGLVNTLDALEAASAEALTWVEFLGGAERYKLELADRIDPLHDAFGLAGTPRGRVAVLARRKALELRLLLKRSEPLRSAYLRMRAMRTS
jgi:CelD/BcsL family acetyltransferase involved in cellulose biosynthesis